MMTLTKLLPRCRMIGTASHDFKTSRWKLPNTTFNSTTYFSCSLKKGSSNTSFFYFNLTNLTTPIKDEHSWTSWDTALVFGPTARKLSFNYIIISIQAVINIRMEWTWIISGHIIFHVLEMYQYQECYNAASVLIKSMLTTPL